MGADNNWVDQKERGASWTIRVMVWLCQRQYRWLVNLLLYPVTAYFFITAGAGREASRHFFMNATGRFSLRDHYQQLLCFANSLVDRVSILRGEACEFQVNAEGREGLLEARKRGRASYCWARI